MCNGAWLAAVAVLLLAQDPALADDKSKCLAGIEALKSQIARHPPKKVLDGLQKKLDDAEQEEVESDWDECLDVIRAKK
jgi:hypothetical protein